MWKKDQLSWGVSRSIATSAQRNRGIFLLAFKHPYYTYRFSSSLTVFIASRSISIYVLCIRWVEFNSILNFQIQLIGSYNMAFIIHTVKRGEEVFAEDMQ